MAEQSHPPYVYGALTNPRQLNRWLDVNAQNGPLTRTRKFITLPSFNVPYTWLGYSDIVVSFNFEAPNNFSLTSLASEIPVSPNYYLCISYRVGGVVTRYALWQNVGEVLFFQSPTLYTGQLIKKNFRLEVWSTSQGSPAINTSNITLYTSVLGDLDYRYGLDSSLKDSDTPCTNFQCLADQTPVSDLIVPTMDYDIPGPALAYGTRIILGFIVGQSYTLSALGNASSLQNDVESHLPGDVFVATTTTYTLVGQMGTFQSLITSQVTGPTKAFSLPMVFQSNAVSVTN